MSFDPPSHPENEAGPSSGSSASASPPYGSAEQYTAMGPAGTQPPQAPPVGHQYPPIAGPPVAGPPGFGPPGAYPPAQSGGPQEGPKQKGSGALIVLAAIAAIALLAASLNLVPRSDSDASLQVSVGDLDTETVVPERRESELDEPSEIQGLESDAAGSVAASAVISIEEFWAEQMPEVFDEPYRAPEGGLYAFSSDEPLPPCAESAEQIAGNAFYCGQDDVIAWDDEGLFPELLEEYGPLSIAAVLAHEWGHAVQARVAMRGRTVTLEHQADCYAGSWVAYAQETGNDFDTSSSALDQALAGFLALADVPGTAKTDPNAHGSAFDRINAFQDGYTEGPSSCATYTNDSITLVQLPFTSAEDAARGGDAPYEQILELTTEDLEDFWSKLAAQEGATWKPLNEARPFNPRTDTVLCGENEVTEYSLFYCADDHYIGFDNADLFPNVYGALGDYAVAILISNQYGYPAQAVLGVESESDREESLTSDCLSGAWTSSVFRRERSTGSLVLSPGDLDEAVGALLAFGDEDESGVGTGFERVASFRSGVLGGVGACGVG